MKRYRKDLDDFAEEFFFKYKITVPDEETKKEIMDAFKHLHDADIDSDYVIVNQLTHEYLDGRNIFVEGTL